MQNNTVITPNNNNDNSTQHRLVGRRTRLGLVGAVVAAAGLFAVATPASASTTCSTTQYPHFLGGVTVAAGDVDGSDEDANFGSTDTTADADGATDSFSFGVEREMKESGEKGGTEDINIGVGELQECTISKSMDMASTKLTQYAINGNSLGVADADTTGSDGSPLEYMKYEMSGFYRR